MIRTLSFEINEEHSGMDIRTFVRQELKLSARVLTSLKYDGEILKNGKAAFSNEKLNAADVLTLRLYDEGGCYEAVPSDIRVLFENEDFLVIDKPAGMPVHPSPGHDNDSVLNCAAWYFREHDDFTFRPLYRLDKDTTGALVIAKNKFAACAELQKTYMAVCEGAVPPSGIIDEPIGLLPGHSIQRCVGVGQRAITEYTLMRECSDYSLVEFNLLTGRTHQIRAHMANIGHPIAGDDMYGGHTNRTAQQMLCCKSVRIACPVLGAELFIETDFPKEQKQAFTELFGGSFDTGMDQSV